MKRKIVALTVVSTALIDQITKALVTSSIGQNSVVPVVTGLFNLVNFRNPGAAFGLLREGDILRTVLLVLVSILALIVIAALLRQSKDGWTIFSLSLIAGGAVGNLIDRVRFGEVVDFLDFYINGWHWPAFNVADSAITAGVVLSLAGFWLRPHTRV
ncbi:MAG: signal peptidase II [Deltaproteobacteria bacterium]|nr:signal peptidase II [Deltaproteobacteria bacterium]